MYHIIYELCRTIKMHGAELSYVEHDTLKVWWTSLSYRFQNVMNWPSLAIPFMVKEVLLLSVPSFISSVIKLFIVVQVFLNPAVRWWHGSYINASHSWVGLLPHVSIVVTRHLVDPRHNSDFSPQRHFCPFTSCNKTVRRPRTFLYQQSSMAVEDCWFGFILHSLSHLCSLLYTKVRSHLSDSWGLAQNQSWKRTRFEVQQLIYNRNPKTEKNRELPMVLSKARHQPDWNAVGTWELCINECQQISMFWSTEGQKILLNDVKGR